MKATIEKAGALIDVAVLYLDDQPKSLVTERELLTYPGKPWWDYVELYSITPADYDRHDVDAVIWKYVRK